MGRPLKQGLEYFPLDLKLGENFELIETEFGNDGFAVMVKFWQAAYAAPKGEIDLSVPGMRALLAKNSRVDISRWEEIIAMAARVKLVDATMLEIGVLTSRGVKKRLKFVNANRLRWRRSKKDIPRGKQGGKHEENGTENTEIIDGQPKDKYTKESKGKKSKGKKKERAPLANPLPVPDVLSRIKNFSETWSAFEALRRKRRWPLSNEYRQHWFEILAKHPKPVEVVQHSLENGYQGLFPDRFLPRTSEKVLTAEEERQAVLRKRQEEERRLREEASRAPVTGPPKEFFEAMEQLAEKMRVKGEL